MGACCSCLRGLLGGHAYSQIPSDEAVVEDTSALPASAQPQQQAQPQVFQNPKGGFFVKYELGEAIGIGSTSTCHRCTDKATGQQFACKVIDKRQIQVKFAGLLEQFYAEIQVLNFLNHRNIIRLADVFETNDRIFMVMELMQGGELFDYVVERGTLSEEEASVFVRQITSAVAHMHSQNIIHRDLKPENLLLTTKSPDAQIKIIDFGLAKVMDEGVARSFLGTRGYLAPEMLQRGSYDKAVDVWALGVIVFVLLCGCLPFDDDSSKITSDGAREKFVLRFPRWAQNLSPDAKDLLVHLLDVDPSTRYTAEQALNHQWVMGKTASKNVLLQSPQMMRALPRIQDTPQTPQGMREMAARMRQQQGQTSTYGSSLNPIQEEAKGARKKSKKPKKNGSRPEEISMKTRKNSI